MLQAEGVTDSVEDGSCTACTGGETTDCTQATCAPRHYNYNPATGTCSACNDMSDASSVITGSCMTCSGPEQADCSSATCNEVRNCSTDPIQKPHSAVIHVAYACCVVFVCCLECM
eukprot:COSAG05_NODE_1973_length_3765_cov_7114.990998_6_plen_116_part_00